MEKRIINRRDKRNFEKEAMQNFDQTLINIHVNVQATYLYVLKKYYGFDTKQINEVAAKAGNVMNSIAKNELTFEEIKKEIDKDENTSEQSN